MTTSTLTRLSAVSAILAGVLFMAIQPLHPPDTISSVATTAWVAIHYVSLVMLMLFVVGITGIYLHQQLTVVVQQSSFDSNLFFIQGNIFLTGQAGHDAVSAHLAKAYQRNSNIGKVAKQVTTVDNLQHRDRFFIINPFYSGQCAKFKITATKLFLRYGQHNACQHGNDQ